MARVNILRSEGLAQFAKNYRRMLQQPGTFRRSRGRDDFGSIWRKTMVEALLPASSHLTIKEKEALGALASPFESLGEVAKPFGEPDLRREIKRQIATLYNEGVQSLTSEEYPPERAEQLLKAVLQARQINRFILPSKAFQGLSVPRSSFFSVIGFNALKITNWPSVLLNGLHMSINRLIDGPASNSEQVPSSTGQVIAKVGVAAVFAIPEFAAFLLSKAGDGLGQVASRPFETDSATKKNKVEVESDSWLTRGSENCSFSRMSSQFEDRDSTLASSIEGEMENERSSEVELTERDSMTTSKKEGEQKQNHAPSSPQEKAAKAQKYPKGPSNQGG